MRSINAALQVGSGQGWQKSEDTQNTSNRIQMLPNCQKEKGGPVPIAVQSDCTQMLKSKICEALELVLVLALELGHNTRKKKLVTLA